MIQNQTVSEVQEYNIKMNNIIKNVFVGVLFFVAMNSSAFAISKDTPTGQQVFGRFVEACVRKLTTTNKTVEDAIKICGCFAATVTEMLTEQEVNEETKASVDSVSKKIAIAEEKCF